MIIQYNETKNDCISIVYKNLRCNLNIMDYSNKSLDSIRNINILKYQ